MSCPPPPRATLARGKTRRRATPPPGSPEPPALPRGAPLSLQVAIVAVEIVAPARLRELASPEALALFDRVLARTAAAYGGHPLPTSCDRRGLVFRDLAAAAMAGLETHRALARERWPTPLREGERLKARMGLHWAPRRPSDVEEPDGLGPRDPALLRAARVAEAAHGGQLLLSEAAARALANRAEITGLRLSHLGRWHLSEGGLPEDLWQAEQSDVPRARWPAPRGRPAPSIPHNLPAVREPVFGRAEPLERLWRLFDEGHRAVLVHGMGGVGKSALLAQHAADLVERLDPGRLRGGVWWVDLRSARGAGEVERTIDAALHAAGSVAEGARSGIAAIGEGLLVLDHADGLGSAIEELVRGWLAERPTLRVLAARRAPPTWSGWGAVLVDPLPVPSAWRPPPAEGALEWLVSEPAVLLLARGLQARSRGGRLAAKSAELAELAAIARLLGGLPLALERAASWLALLGPAELRARLGEDPFPLLVARRPAADPREQPLASLLEGMWVELPSALRAALASLSALQGSFDERGAELALGPLVAGPTTSARRTLETLRARGLLAPADASGARWRLDPLLARAARGLDPDRHESASERLFTRRLARARAALIEPALPDPAAWRDLLDEAEALGQRDPPGPPDPTLDGARLLLLDAQGPPEQTLALAGRLEGGDAPEGAARALFRARALLRLGRGGEARALLQAVADDAASERGATPRAVAARELAALALDDQDVDAAKARAQQALSLALGVGSPALEAAARVLQARLARTSGGWRTALDALERARALLEALPAGAERAEERMETAALLREMGDAHAALEAAERARDLLEAEGRRHRALDAAALRGLLLGECSRAEEALDQLETLRAARAAMGGAPRPEEAFALGLTAAELGRLQRARSALSAAEDESYATGRRALLGPILLCRAELELRASGASEARPWVERAERLLDSAGPRGQAWSAVMRARRELLLGDREEAAQDAEEARLLLDGLSDPTAARMLRPLERAIWASLDADQP